MKMWMSTITFTKIFKIEKYINFNFQVLSIQSLASSAKILKTKMKTFLKSKLNKIYRIKKMTISTNKKYNLFIIINLLLKKRW